MMEETLELALKFLEKLLDALAVFIVLIVMAFIFLPTLIVSAEAATVLAVAGMVIVIASTLKNPNPPTDKIDPKTTSLSLRFGHISVEGITASQLALFNLKYQQIVQAFFIKGPLDLDAQSPRIS